MIRSDPLSLFIRLRGFANSAGFEKIPDECAEHEDCSNNKETGYGNLLDGPQSGCLALNSDVASISTNGEKGNEDYLYGRSAIEGGNLLFPSP